MATTLPTVTGWSPLYGSTPNAYQLLFGRHSNDYHAARALGASGMRGIRRIARVLNGAAPGSNATETVARIAPATPFNTATGGGARVVETITEVNRNTTAADVTYINANILDRIYAMTPPIASYPPDLSGNGGATSKRGY
jgi:hypothetical protein